MRHNSNNAKLWQSLALKALCVLLLSGCNVTITDPIPEHSALDPLLPSATPSEFVVVVESGARSAHSSVAGPWSDGEEAILKQLYTPTATPTATASVTPAISPTATPAPTWYEVVEGDTLGVIAIKHAINVSDLMNANNLTDADTLSIGQKLLIPSASEIVAAEAQKGTPIPTPQTESGDLIHYVQVGETPSSIAAQYGVDKIALLLANGFRPEVQLMAGDAIIVPQGEYEAIPTATALPPTTVPTVQVALAPSSTLTASPPASATPTATPAPNAYTVQPGDYARTIASNHGITLDALKAANPGVAMDTLAVGQLLTIPPATEAASERAPATGTAVTLNPTATPTALPPVMVTHVVAADETLASIAQDYGLTEETLRGFNEQITDTLALASVVQVPIGTPTPTPAPTLPPTITPTRAPEYLAPIPLLPANGSTWMHWEGKTPLQLVWTSTGILKDNEFYVVRLRAVEENGDVRWAISEWTQNPSWRLSPDLLDSIDGRVKLRWDVMVMRRTSAANAETPTGVALSNKSPTFELTFVNSN